jgi:PAS domain S-box-containing protein
MKDTDKTKEQLISELEDTHQRIVELETLETERKKGKSEIIKAAKEWEATFDSINDMVSIHDKDFNLVRVNKAFCDLLKKKREEIIGKKCYEVLHESNEPWPECPHKQTMKVEKPFTEEFFEPKLGIYLQVSTSPIFGENREIIGTVHIAKDITERKKAEKELKRAKDEIELWNKELEERVKEKSEELVKSQNRLIETVKLSAMGQIAGGLAHELNSPLAGIIPMIERYLKKANKGSDEHNEFTLMLKAADHMAKVVKDFGVFSRKSKSEFKMLSLNEVIEDTLSFSAVRLRQKGIKVKKELSARPPLIRGDKTELQQVVLNMLSNAFYALPEGGRFIIRTDISEDNKAVMEFIDNGIGIEKENIDKIFEPFFTTKQEGEGTGLGLSVTYGIIVKHGGEISVESEPWKGTKFTIILPAVEYK